MEGWEIVDIEASFASVTQVRLKNAHQVSLIHPTYLQQEEQTLPCATLLCCDQLYVDPELFYAMIDSCLVYDGRLVINHQFQTSDPSIYAIGKLTKYSQSVPQEDVPFEVYNEKELGKRVCHSLIHLTCTALFLFFVSI